MSGLIALACDATILQIGIAGVRSAPAGGAPDRHFRRNGRRLARPPPINLFADLSPYARRVYPIFRHRMDDRVAQLCRVCYGTLRVAGGSSAGGTGNRVNSRHIFRIHRNALWGLPGKSLAGPSAATGIRQKKWHTAEPQGSYTGRLVRNYSLTVQLQWHSIALAPGTFTAVANRRLQSTGIRQKDRLRVGVITSAQPNPT